MATLDSIKNSIKSAEIGSGVSNLYDIASTTSIGGGTHGLVYYSHKNKKYLSTALSYNYYTERDGRYSGYNNYLFPTGYKLESNRLAEANISHNYISDINAVNTEGDNAEKKFITDEYFTRLNDLLREKEQMLLYTQLDYERKYYDNSSKFIGYGLPRLTNFGDEYDVNENGTALVRLHTNLKETNKYYYKDLKNLQVENSFYESKIASQKNNIASRRLLGGDYNFLDEIDEAIRQEYSSAYSSVNDIMSRLCDNGLYECNAEYRNKYINDNITFYGIKGLNNTIDVEDVTRSTGDDYLSNASEYTSTNIDDEFTYGGHFNPNYAKPIHSFYREPDGKESNIDSFGSTSITDDSVITMDSYSGSSRLLKYTSQLFMNHKIGSLINRFHTDSIEGDETTSSFSTYGISRGRNLLRKDAASNKDNKTGYDDPYCRVWTSAKQYSRLRDRIRPFYDGDNAMSISDLQVHYGGLRTGNGAQTLNNNSVLMSNGYVRITPTSDNKGNITKDKDNNTIKKYMFSIENLAWKDTQSALSEEQRGDNGGRIMWFPPYNLKFNEQVNVDWNPNEFIGRGEKIYTYRNTERTGSLSFTLLIDHPSILNKIVGQQTTGQDKNELQNDILRYFAGCDTLNDKLDGSKYKYKSQNGNGDDEGNNNDDTTERGDVTTNPTPKAADYFAFVLFFPNDMSARDVTGNTYNAMQNLSRYEMTSDNTKYGSDRDKEYKEEILKEKNIINYNRYSLNNITNAQKQSIIDTLSLNTYNINENKLFFLSQYSGSTFVDSSEFSKVTEYIHKDNFEIGKIFVKGFASSHGYTANNSNLCKHRAECIRNILKYQVNDFSKDDLYEYINGQTIQVSKDEINALDAKIARAAVAIVKIVQKDDVTPASTPTEGTTSTVENFSFISIDGKGAMDDATNNNLVTVTTTAEDKYDSENEYLFFKEIVGNTFYFNNIVDKVRYFDPAYHSITPEGFNARLTFLHQCTRQGPTMSLSDNAQSGNVNNNYLKYAGNLSFGRAPYCILRIGDFFNTKIIINSVSIDYNNGDGTQWDLNPEGIGVQPMFANVTLSFVFLGGQDIEGPIERLQNAVTANYYANASIYDKKADNSITYYDAVNNTNIVKDIVN